MAGGKWEVGEVEDAGVVVVEGGDERRCGGCSTSRERAVKEKMWKEEGGGVGEVRPMERGATGDFSIFSGSVSFCGVPATSISVARARPAGSPGSAVRNVPEHRSGPRRSERSGGT